MKIRKINWKDHPIFGTFELSFLDGSSKPYNTIVIAGENGTGKTTILEIIYSYLKSGVVDETHNFEFIEYQTDDEILRYSIAKRGENNYQLVMNKGGSVRQGEPTYYSDNRWDSVNDVMDKRRSFACVYTKAHIVDETQKITSIGTHKLDEDLKKEKTRFEATDIKQLFVDLSNQDDQEFTSLAKQIPDKSITWNEYKPDSRMERFSSAFDKFFDGAIRYGEVRTMGSSHEILFKKGDKDIKIDNLSTGESQIVYRGAYLLKNVGRLKGSIILIDEPEISMHPSWQEKILTYYRGLFTVKGEQIAQIIVVTHSHEVIKEAYRLGDVKVIVLRRSNEGVLSHGEDDVKAVLKRDSFVETIYQAFGEATTDYHNALYGYIEEKKMMGDFTKGKTLVDYIKLNDNGTTKQEKVSLSEKIRHIIHHPENTNNSYTPAELRQSIEAMRNYIINKGI